MKTKHAVLLWKCTFFFSLFLTYSSRIWISFYCSGDSANAVPPTKKLRTRVTNICGDRRGQPNRSAMERPHSGPTAVVIAVQPVPGKYAWNRLSGPQFPGTICPGRCDVICTRLASPQMVKLQPSYPVGTPSAPATTPTPGAMPARNHIGPQ